MTDLPDNPRDMVQLMRDRSVKASPFTAWLNIDLIRCWAGEAEMTIPVRPDLTQHRGTVHGGILGIAADNVSCWAASSLIGPLVTASYTIHFVAPGVGKLVRAVGRVARAGKRSAVVNAEIFVETDDDRSLVATALCSVTAISEKPV